MRIPVHFFKEKFNQLRLGAQVVYDRGILQGLPQEKIYEQLAPITKTLGDFSRQAVTEDLRGLIFTIKSLQHEAKAHGEDAKFLIEKQMNTLNHIEKIEQHIWAEMKRRNVTELVDEDFSVVLVESDGKSVLTYR